MRNKTILTFIILFISIQVYSSNTPRIFCAYNSDGQPIYYLTTQRFVEVCNGGYGVRYAYSGVLNIPSTVTYGENTFNVVGIADDAFSGCNGLTSVTIPNTVTSIGENAFSGCSGLTSITIPSSVTSIGNYAFSGCSGLTSITIPGSVTSIGNYAFSGCTDLTNVSIGSSVIIIGETPFSHCTNLNTIIVDSNNSLYDSRNNCNAIIQKYSNKLIAGCKNTTIPNSVTTIGVSAFKNCTSLTNIIIPSSVTSIEYSAFWGCSGLTSITSLPIIAPHLQGYVFYEASRAIPVYIPCGSLQSYCSEWPHVNTNNFFFIDDWSYSISALSANDNMGEVSVLAQPTCSSPTATIQAVANNGYRFTRWSDGETNNPRIVNVTSDTTIIAHFDVVNGIETNESLVQIYEQGGSFYINGAEGEALVIYDVYGRVIYQGTAEDNKTYEMPQSGVYMVKVGNNPAQKVVIK